MAKTLNKANCLTSSFPLWLSLASLLKRSTYMPLLSPFSNFLPSPTSPSLCPVLSHSNPFNSDNISLFPFIFDNLYCIHPIFLLSCLSCSSLFLTSLFCFTSLSPLLMLLSFHSSVEPWEGNSTSLRRPVRTHWGGFSAASGADWPHHEKQPTRDSSGPGSTVRTVAGQ